LRLRQNNGFLIKKTYNGILKIIKPKIKIEYLTNGRLKKETPERGAQGSNSTSCSSFGGGAGRVKCPF